MTSPVTIHAGADAQALLNDLDFLARWRDLYECAPEATAFQGVAFVKCWYDSYASSFEPVIVCWRDSAGGLQGLLTLAESRLGRRLVATGTHQAEYQSWLARADGAIPFMEQAWASLRSRFPGQALRFKYLPDGLCRELAEATDLRRFAEIVPRRRPVMTLDDAQHAASLRKKSNKSRLNRLRKLGEVRIERVTSATHLDAVFDEIIGCYDLRQGAINNNCPFQDDPAKRAFHLALLHDPDLLHVALLRVGADIAAAHLGVATRDVVHLGIIAHSPAYTRYSAGKILLMLLGQQLADEGFAMLDLTPGDDPWKERFADRHEQVCELTLHPSRLSHVSRRLEKTALSLVKSAAAMVGVTPPRVRAAAGRLAAWRQRSMASGLAGAECDFFRYTGEPPRDGGSEACVNRDVLADLLKFQPANGSLSRQAFLADALARLENGEHVYTSSRNGRLLYCIWVRRVADAHILHAACEAPDPGILSRDLGQILAELRRSGDLGEIQLVLARDSRAWRQAAEALGFQYRGRISAAQPHPARGHRE